MKIKRFDNYSLLEGMIDDFISSFDGIVKEDFQGTVDDEKSNIINKFKERFGSRKPSEQEFADFYHELRVAGIDGIKIFNVLGPYMSNDDKFSDVSAYKRVEKKVLSDLKLDMKLILTFGSGIGALYPVIDVMMKNLNLSGVDINIETVVLLTIASLTIVFLEEKKFKSPDEESKLIKDSKSMLEELRMRGIGDGIVKKVIKSIQSIKNIFSIIGKHIGAVIGGVIDMFSYTSILIPIMNAILFIIGKYDMSIDNVIQNFFALGIGVSSRIAKHGLVELINKLKGKLNFNKEKVIDEIETPVIQKFATFGDSEKQEDGDLIKEQ